MAGVDYIKLVEVPGGAALATNERQDIYFVLRRGESACRISLETAAKLYIEHGANETNLIWRKPKRRVRKKSAKSGNDTASWRDELRAKLGYRPDVE